MNKLEFLSAGLYTTLQDFGRFGFRKFGVPVSGVMDQQSAALANILVKNQPDLPLLEINLMGPKIKFSAKTLIAITGADISPKLNKKPIKLNQAISIKKNDILSFHKLNYGARAYIAIHNGFCSKKIMESVSMHPNVTSKGSFLKGDILKYYSLSETPMNTNASIKIDKSHFEDDKIEVLEGPEYHILNQDVLDHLISNKFKVTPLNSRMGYQLVSDNFKAPSFSDILTSSVLPGTVQLTPSGKLIILMRDCQTTGGYPRIFQLTENAINKLSQKKSGDTIFYKQKNLNLKS